MARAETAAKRHQSLENPPIAAGAVAVRRVGVKISTTRKGPENRGNSQKVKIDEV
jgi:hypothetical protein